MTRMEEMIFAASYALNRRLDVSCAAVLEFRSAKNQGLGPEGKQIVAEAQFGWNPSTQASAEAFAAQFVTADAALEKLK